MPTAVENQFVHNYSKLLVQVWTDPGFIQRLQAQPNQVLKEYGIAVPANVRINIIREVPANQQVSLDTQVKDWQQAEQSGVLNLYIPQGPQLGQETSGGVGDYSVADTSYCCCCCPCCTCT